MTLAYFPQQIIPLKYSLLTDELIGTYDLSKRVIHFSGFRAQYEQTVTVYLGFAVNFI